MRSIGADVAEAKIDICIYDHPTRTILKELVISNDSQGFQELEEESKTFNVSHLLLESTGGLELPFCHYFDPRIENVLILNPKQVKKFKEALFEDQNLTPERWRKWRDCTG